MNTDIPFPTGGVHPRVFFGYNFEIAGPKVAHDNANKAGRHANHVCMLRSLVMRHHLDLLSNTKAIPVARVLEIILALNVLAPLDDGGSQGSNSRGKLEFFFLHNNMLNCVIVHRLACGDNSRPGLRGQELGDICEDPHIGEHSGRVRRVAHDDYGAARALLLAPPRRALVMVAILIVSVRSLLCIFLPFEAMAQITGGDLK